ncbi:hypothetical protein LV78_003897 [Actinosynnema pretiosum]|nr:hypothetical protein [Actinosynnema pretiosum]
MPVSGPEKPDRGVNRAFARLRRPARSTLTTGGARVLPGVAPTPTGSAAGPGAVVYPETAEPGAGHSPLRSPGGLLSEAERSANRGRPRGERLDRTGNEGCEPDQCRSLPVTVARGRASPVAHRSEGRGAHRPAPRASGGRSATPEQRSGAGPRFAHNGVPKPRPLCSMSFFRQSSGTRFRARRAVPEAVQEDAVEHNRSMSPDHLANRGRHFTGPHPRTHCGAPSTPPTAPVPNGGANDRTPRFRTRGEPADDHSARSREPLGAPTEPGPRGVGSSGRGSNGRGSNGRERAPGRRARGRGPRC